MGAPRPHLDDVTRLSDGVIRILGQNPGKFTLQGTNTYLIGKGPKRILIDTGEGQPTWTKLLKETLEKEKATLETVLITHWHRDHTGGIQDVLDLDPASPPKVYKHQPEGLVSNDIAENQVFKVEGATLTALHTPGHTYDHMAFQLAEEDAIFTGDNVLGHGTAVFEDLPTYLKTLEGMAKRANGRGYPGHGLEIVDLRSRIGEYISHRQQREREIVDVMARGEEGQGFESMELVSVIYKDVPESLHLAAARGVVQVLDKLTDEGRLEHDEEKGTWALKGRASM